VAAALIWACGLSVAAGIGIRQNRMLINDEDREEVIETAEACVVAWQAREDVRDSGEAFARGAVHTANQALIQIGIEQGDPPPPGVEERFTEITEQLLRDDIARARAQLPDPACDLEDARRTLENE
jgi:hypothetical protein